MPGEKMPAQMHQAIWEIVLNCLVEWFRKGWSVKVSKKLNILILSVTHAVTEDLRAHEQSKVLVTSETAERRNNKNITI